MPSLQVVDTTRDKPEPTGVQEFFSKLGKDYKDKSDRVEIGKLINEYQSNREDANAYENLQLGLEKSNIGPTKRIETQKSLNEMRKNINERDKLLNDQVKAGQATHEKQQSLLGAKKRIEEQKQRVASGHIGPTASFFGTSRKGGSSFSKEGQRIRAEYEQAGKSLIQYASSIPIRNRLEFETLGEKLYDPKLTKEEAEGTYKAMEDIIDDSLAAVGYKGEKETPQAANGPSKFSEGQTATGPNGQKIIFKGGQWQQV